MYEIMDGALFLLSVAMAAFSLRVGYVPVSRPIHRVYRNRHPVYFWTLIGGYGLVGAICLIALARKS